MGFQNFGSGGQTSEERAYVPPPPPAPPTPAAPEVAVAQDAAVGQVKKPKGRAANVLNSGGYGLLSSANTASRTLLGS